jgi:hypothetical protein
MKHETTLMDIVLAASLGLMGGSVLALVYIVRTGGF